MLPVVQQFLSKRGGLAAAWEDSKAMAGWISAPDPAAEAQDVEWFGRKHLDVGRVKGLGHF